MQNNSVMREQNEYNTALGFVIRLEVLWKQVEHATVANDAWDWYQTLILLYKNLSTELKGTEQEDFFKELMSMLPLVKKSMNKNSLTYNNSIPYELYKQLTMFELKLRRVMKESGLQAKMKKDPRFAMV